MRCVTAWIWAISSTRSTPIKSTSVFSMKTRRNTAGFFDFMKKTRRETPVFQDGNKRIALSLGAQFLLLNGYVFVATRFMREMENISYHVANGNIDKDLLKEIICAVIEDRLEEDEELKLKIVNAIFSGEIE
jgi:hypothetical protein